MKQPVIAALLLLLTASAYAADNASPAQLFNHIWQVTNPSAAQGSIYIFLRNGTLLETSCVETYRIATWKADPPSPRTLVVTEDGSPAFTATISELTSTTLRFQQNLLFAKERRDFSLTAIDKEFLCPDMPK